jgi:hypothetical protein
LVTFLVTFFLLTMIASLPALPDRGADEAVVLEDVLANEVLVACLGCSRGGAGDG